MNSDNNEDIGILTPPLIGRNLTEMTSYRVLVQSQNTAHKEFPNSLSIRKIYSKTGYLVDINSKREKWGAGEIQPENGSLPHKTGE